MADFPKHPSMMLDRVQLLCKSMVQATVRVSWGWNVINGGNPAKVKAHSMVDRSQKEIVAWETLVKSAV